MNDRLEMPPINYLQCALSDRRKDSQGEKTNCVFENRIRMTSDAESGNDVKEEADELDEHEDIPSDGHHDMRDIHNNVEVQEDPRV
jgi:hypothetical protein